MYIERNGHPIHYLNMSAFSNSSIIYWPCQLLGLVHVIALLIFALDMGLVFLSLHLNKEKQGCSSGENAHLPPVRPTSLIPVWGLLWIKFVVALLQKFFPRFSGFSSSKQTPPNSNFSMIRTCMKTG